MVRTGNIGGSGVVGPAPVGVQSQPCVHRL